MTIIVLAIYVSINGLFSSQLAYHIECRYFTREVVIMLAMGLNVYCYVDCAMQVVIICRLHLKERRLVLVRDELGPDRLQTRSRGLTVTEIEMLPDVRILLTTDDCCAICLEPLE
jgi:hypothetical protein